MNIKGIGWKRQLKSGFHGCPPNNIKNKILVYILEIQTIDYKVMMDSGIDSTESSNGSVDEGGMEGSRRVADGVTSDVPRLDLRPDVTPTDIKPDVTSCDQRPDITTCDLKSGTPSLQCLAASVVEDAANQALRNASPAAQFPEGSRLQLHFPLEAGRDADLEPPPGLTFANVSPSMYLSRGYEAYSQGYAVLPYENNSLRSKLKNLRMRVRQHQHAHISIKAKERKLRIAASLNNVETVERLLSDGVNPKVTDDKDRSPLHIAASKGYTEIAKLLLQHGADPNQRDGVGNTALHLAACTSHVPTVTLLLKAGTDVKQADNQGYSPLHLARSKLKLLARDNNASSKDIRQQVCQVIEMMQTYLECSGNSSEAELLTSFTSQLSLSDSRQQMETDLQTLLNSLNDLSLVNSKQA